MVRQTTHTMDLLVSVNSIPVDRRGQSRVKTKQSFICYPALI
ncbi:uncharacterized protein METZ01_LOCUS422703 [marine metagenome]|uniref:Uncharacterized protein n=1 Tax=marine metagenome TaxID=408172 RepID=A0A382XG78_9ZZZZ